MGSVVRYAIAPFDFLRSVVEIREPGLSNFQFSEIRIKSNESEFSLYFLTGESLNHKLKGKFYYLIRIQTSTVTQRSKIHKPWPSAPKTIFGCK